MEPMDVMIKKLLIILIIFFIPAIGFAVTVTQTGAGADLSVAQFNALTGNKAGTTYYFSGTITTEITPQIYGSGGNYVILDGYATDDTTYMNLSEASGRALIDLSSTTKDGIKIVTSYIAIQDFEMTDCEIGIMITDAAGWTKIKRTYIHECHRNGIYMGHATLRSENILIGGERGHGNVLKNIGHDTAGADIVSCLANDVVVSYNHLYANDLDGGNWGIDGVVPTCFYSYRFLVEYNSIHGHQKSSIGDKGEDGIDFKKGVYDSVIRFNNIYDNRVHSVNLNGAHEVYVYGNRLDGTDNVTGAGVYQDDDIIESGIYVFSNIIANHPSRGITSVALSGSDLTVFNNTFALNAPGAMDNSTWGHMYLAGRDVTAKNNIFYKSRPDETDYRQYYIATNTEQYATFDYNLYYWPSQTSQMFWGDDGWKNLSGLDALGQEANGSEENPDLTDIDNDDYTIASNTSGAYNAGIDMGSGNITSITIRGLTVNVPWDFALGPNTVWGTGATLPIIDEQLRDSHQWDAGAYVFTTDTSPPVVTVTVTDDSALESGTTTGSWTLHCSPACSNVDVTYALSGTATVVNDYTIVSETTVNIDGLSAVVTITAVDDSDVEAYEEIATLTISADPSGSDYTVGTPASGNISIYSEDAGMPIYDYGVNKVRGAKLK